MARGVNQSLNQFIINVIIVVIAVVIVVVLVVTAAVDCRAHVRTSSLLRSSAKRLAISSLHVCCSDLNDAWLVVMNAELPMSSSCSRMSMNFGRSFGSFFQHTASNHNPRQSRYVWTIHEERQDKNLIRREKPNEQKTAEVGKR